MSPAHYKNKGGTVRFLACLLALLPSVAMAEQFWLACHWVPAIKPFGQEYPPLDENYLIDLDRGTVNNSPAEISEATISFNYTRSETPYTVVINRVTGRGFISTPKVGPLFSGTCEKATQRKF